MKKHPQKNKKFPSLGIIGRGAFGIALQNVLTPLVGKTLKSLCVLGREAMNQDPKKAPDILILAIPSTAKNPNGQVAILDYVRKFSHSKIILTSKGENVLKIYKKFTIPEKNRIFMLSGPNLAEQMGHTPTATMLAGKNWETTLWLQEKLTSSFFHIYASKSPIVIQKSGSLKNFLVYELGKVWSRLKTPEKKIEMILLALEAGYEAIKLVAPKNEKAFKFWGLSGLGDILLCLDFFPKGPAGSRNFQAGELFGSGMSEEKIQERMRTLEGMTIAHDFYSSRPPKFMTVPAMNRLRQALAHPEKIKTPSSKISRNNPIVKHGDEIWRCFWSLFDRELGDYQSNTRTWFFCRIFQKLMLLSGLSAGNINNIKSVLRPGLRSLLVSRKRPESIKHEQHILQIFCPTPKVALFQVLGEHIVPCNKEASVTGKKIKLWIGGAIPREGLSEIFFSESH